MKPHRRTRRTLFPALLLALGTLATAGPALAAPHAPSAPSTSTADGPRPRGRRARRGPRGRHAGRLVPAAVDRPGGDTGDLAPLARVIGDAKVVGLGEATHSSHEFFTLKAASSATSWSTRASAPSPWRLPGAPGGASTPTCCTARATRAASCARSSRTPTSGGTTASTWS
ncbi:hypothetical protein NKH77_12035 [Streptomyces sp. M19]